MNEQMICSSEVAASAPTRILIIPDGQVLSSSGNFVLDAQGAVAIMQDRTVKAVDAVIDYEHQTLGGTYSAPAGLAPAAGWLKALEYVPGEGLWANVEWTEKARAALAAREYRYLSPVVIVRTSDRRAVELHSVALTNTPAIRGMKPLVNKDGTNATETPEGPADSASSKETAMRDQLIGMLALKSDASDDEVLAAVKALVERAGEAENQVAEASKAAGLSPEKLAAGLLVLKQQAADTQALADRLAKAETTLAEQHCERLINAAKDAGKLVEAQEPWAKALIAKDPAGFEAYVASAPVVRQLGATTAPTGTGSAGRQAIVAKAAGEWAGSKELQGLTCKAAFVNDALRQAGEKTLSDEEAKAV